MLTGTKLLTAGLLNASWKYRTVCILYTYFLHDRES